MIYCWSERRQEKKIKSATIFEDLRERENYIFLLEKIFVWEVSFKLHFLPYLLLGCAQI